ncbi:MAG: ABC transporter permease [Vicinamibacterales bacterium]
MAYRLASDLRHGFRWFLRSPGFTLVAALSLAAGIGLNASIFSVADALLFRPLPVNEPGRLVDVFTSASDGDPYSTNSYLDYLDLRAENEVFTDMLAFSPMIAVQNLEDRSRLLLGEVVTGNYFALLGVPAQVGRTITAEDDRGQAERVAMVSDRFWRQDLGGGAGVLGSTIRIGGHRYTIVGVTPSWFTGMTPIVDPAIWVPVAHAEEVEPAGISESVRSPTGTGRLDRRGYRWMFVKGRLKPGVDAAAAQANLQVVMARLGEAHPETNKGRRMSAIPTNEVRLHPSATQALLPMAAGLMIAVALALLIVCANVANMLLARTSARARELAVRRALGASRWQVVRQLLTENLILAAAGGIGGVALAWWATDAASALDLGIPIPLTLDLRLDVRVLLFTVALTSLAGIIAGIGPALRASSADPMRGLHARGESAVLGRRRITLQGTLVAGQIGIAVVLMVSAGLLSRSLMAASHADLGFDPKGIAIIATDAEMAGYDQERSRQFWEQAVERVRAMPGVEHVALASRLPFSINFSNTSLHIPGHNTPGDTGTTVSSVRVSGEYFDMLGIRLLEGRTFSPADTPETPRVAIVNDTMAKRFWPGESAVGKRVVLRDAGNVPVEIVGVVADHRIQTIGEGPRPQVHFAQAQRFDSYQVLAARTRGDAEHLLGEIRRTLLAMEPNLVFVEGQTLETQVAATLLPVRAGAWLVGFVGLLGAALAAIGLYGVVAYSVARRTREIGIRLAIGSSPVSVLGMVMRRGGWLILSGVALGVPMAAAAATLIAGAVYGVGVADPVAWGASVSVVVAVAALASFVPAWRASRLDPVVALRVE